MHLFQHLVRVGHLGWQLPTAGEFDETQQFGAITKLVFDWEQWSPAQKVPPQHELPVSRIEASPLFIAQIFIVFIHAS